MIRPHSARERRPGAMAGTSLDVRAMRPTSARTATRTSAAMPNSGCLGINIVPPQRTLLDPESYQAHRRAPVAPDYPNFVPSYTGAIRQMRVAAAHAAAREREVQHQQLREATVSMALGPDSKVTDSGITTYAAISTLDNNVTAMPGKLWPHGHATREEIAAHLKAMVRQARACSTHVVKAMRVTNAAPATLAEIQQLLDESDKLQTFIDQTDALEDAGAKAVITVPMMLDAELLERQMHMHHVASKAHTLGGFHRKGLRGAPTLAQQRRLQGFTRAKVQKAHAATMGEAGQQLLESWDIVGLGEKDVAELRAENIDDVSLSHDSIPFRVPAYEAPPPAPDSIEPRRSDMEQQRHDALRLAGVNGASPLATPAMRAAVAGAAPATPATAEVAAAAAAAAAGIEAAHAEAEEAEEVGAGPSAADTAVMAVKMTAKARASLAKAAARDPEVRELSENVHGLCRDLAKDGTVPTDTNTAPSRPGSAGSRASSRRGAITPHEIAHISHVVRRTNYAQDKDPLADPERNADGTPVVGAASLRPPKQKAGRSDAWSSIEGAKADARSPRGFGAPRGIAEEALRKVGTGKSRYRNPNAKFNEAPPPSQKADEPAPPPAEAPRSPRSLRTNRSSQWVPPHVPARARESKARPIIEPKALVATPPVRLPVQAAPEIPPDVVTPADEATSAAATLAASFCAGAPPCAAPSPAQSRLAASGDGAARQSERRDTGGTRAVASPLRMQEPLSPPPPPLTSERQPCLVPGDHPKRPAPTRPRSAQPPPAAGTPAAPKRGARPATAGGGGDRRRGGGHGLAKALGCGPPEGGPHSEPARPRTAAETIAAAEERAAAKEAEKLAAARAIAAAPQSAAQMSAKDYTKLTAEHYEKLSEQEKVAPWDGEVPLSPFTPTA